MKSAHKLYIAMLFLLGIGFLLLVMFFFHNAQLLHSSKSEQAVELLKQAHHAEETGNWPLVIRNSELVAGQEDLPDDIRSFAFMLLGEYGIASHRLNIALVSYLLVLKLPNAPDEEKQKAQSAIDFIHQMTGSNVNPRVHLPGKNVEKF